MLVPRIGRIHGHLTEDAAWIGRHHHNAGSKGTRFQNRMSDEDKRSSHRFPQLQQIIVEAEARDLVERGEGFVHQQDFRRITSARAMDTRIFMPRRVRADSSLRISEG